MLDVGHNMIRLSGIVTIRVAATEPRTGWLTVRCLSGRAKWSPDSQLLSVKADVVDDEAVDKWAEFIDSEPPAFELELDTQTGASPEGISTSRFSSCVHAALEWRSGTVRPKGPNTTHYYLKATAELGAAPNGGPAERLGNSGAGGGPPSVS
jgi:hypothetical protein